MENKICIADITSIDTGGQSYKLARAISNYTENISRSFITGLDYINFPYDILKGKHDQEFVNQYLANVDVIHLHNKYRHLNGWGVINPKAKILIHQHGRFGADQNMQEIYDADKQRGALRCVSTFNLLRYVNYDPSRWIPAPFNLKEMQGIKDKNFKEHDKIKIAHSPTNRTYKNTQLLIDICKDIKEVELVLIENMPYSKSLELRSGCDITFDQMHLCYGNSGLEGMCFGQPVIAGMPQEVREVIRSYVGYEPFVFATPETLKEVILKLVSDRDMRQKYSNISTMYINNYHDDKFVAERVLNLYNRC